MGPLLLFAALGLACAGDVALLIRAPGAFLVGLVFFLGAQFCLLTAFVRRARPRWPVVVAGGLIWLTANMLLWGRLGDLRVPVLIYSLALIAVGWARRRPPGSDRAW